MLSKEICKCRHRKASPTASITSHADIFILSKDFKNLLNLRDLTSKTKSCKDYAYTVDKVQICNTPHRSRKPSSQNQRYFTQLNFSFQYFFMLIYIHIHAIFIMRLCCYNPCRRHAFCNLTSWKAILLLLKQQQIMLIIIIFIIIINIICCCYYYKKKQSSP